jgi:hypothetical protein
MYLLFLVTVMVAIFFIMVAIIVCVGVLSVVISTVLLER